MIHDLHSHTYYSMCGRDNPHLLAEAALAGGIELLGISDHNYGIRPDRYAKYRAEIAALREEYRGRLVILCGIEVNTKPCWVDPPLPNWTIPDEETLGDFDYCLVEYIDQAASLTGGDIIPFARKRKTRVGIAHTDLFSHCAARGWDPLTYFTALAKENIFWEMNVSYDSIHGWREHAYMLEFRKNEAQQDIIRRSGIRLSVGFDGHRIEDYAPERVRDMHAFLAERGLETVSF